MGAIIPVATTELQALNQMLSVIGEAPVASTASTQADVVMAMEILLTVAREVTSLPWRFNTEYKYPLTAAGTVAEVGVTRSYYTVPANLASWSLSKTSPQANMEVVVRYSRVAGTPGVTVIFADRINARDGLDMSSNADLLHIDPVWFYDFLILPQAARRFITIAASRRFQRAVVGSSTLERFSETDELVAYAALKREEGIKEDFNMFANAETLRALGGRYAGPYGVLDIRDSRRR